jgi:hypothetical protein
MEAKKMLVSLNVDTSELQFQLAALNELLEPVILEHIIDESLSTLRGSIRCLLDDIIFSDFSTTDGAANPHKICIKVKIGGLFDLLATTIRAGNCKSNFIRH